MYKAKDYDYDLREELIAQVPVSNRDRSRLLFVERSNDSLSDHHFFDLPGLLKPGDLLVINNARVVPAKLFGRKESGGTIEILVLEHPDSSDSLSGVRWCLLKSSKRPKLGSRLLFKEGVTGIVKDLGEGGLIKIAFSGDISIDSLLKSKGLMPLPPYIKRVEKNGYSTIDRDRYQTVYSSRDGAVAAPTAGLHFTKGLLEELDKAGITIVELTLYIGHGTFRPVRTDDIRDHDLGEERYLIESRTTEAINQAKKEGRRIIAVGTTAVRTLETVCDSDGKVSSGTGSTNLLITPGFRFNVVDGIITNFHLPKSSLLFLVSAFGGVKLVRKAYQRAIKSKYRFYSYGDAMLII